MYLSTGEGKDQERSEHDVWRPPLYGACWGSTQHSRRSHGGEARGGEAPARLTRCTGPFEAEVWMRWSLVQRVSER